jgi:transcriptional regulator with XRE-family HTH domain
MEIPHDPMSPNDVVAWNLRAAREMRGWTQEQAAAQLEPHIGQRWSKASYSAAENGQRQFDANTLFALARAFDVSLPFFFMPAVVNFPVRHPDAGDEPVQPLELAAMLLVPDEHTSRAVNLPRMVDRRELLDRRLEAMNRASLYEVDAQVGALRKLLEGS